MLWMKSRLGTAFFVRYIWHIPSNDIAYSLQYNHYLLINYYFVDSIIHIIFDLPWCQILFIRFLSSLMDKKWIHGRSYGCGSIPGHRCCCAETSSVQFGGRGPPSSLLGPFNQETARWIVTGQEETAVTKRQWEDLVNWRWSHNAANTTNCSGRI